MSGNRRLCSALVLAWMAVLAGPLEAQPASAQAEALFRRGKELLAAGRTAEACDAFDASQKLEPRPTTQLNQANCRERNRQLATAWGLFVEVARVTRPGADKASQQMYATATARAASLEPRLSTLRVDVSAASRIPDLEVRRGGERVDPATWNLVLPVDGGTYFVEARAPGRLAWSREVVVSAERDAQIVQIPALEVAVPGAGPGLAEPRPIIERRASSPGGLRWSPKRKLAVGVASGGVVALAAGGVIGVLALRRRDQAHDVCPDPQRDCDAAPRANELVRSAHNLAIGANVALGVGAAAGITAGVLWLTGAPEPRQVAIAPVVAPGYVLVTMGGHF